MKAAITMASAFSRIRFSFPLSLSGNENDVSVLALLAFAGA
jgi:hypothetical protein